MTSLLFIRRYQLLSSNQESRDIIFLQIRNQEILSFFKSGIKRFYLSSNKVSREIIFLQIRNQEILSFFKSNSYLDFKRTKIITPNTGADTGFQVSGDLKKLCRAERGAKIFWVFRVKNHDFTPTNLIFSNFRGWSATVIIT